MTSLSILAHLNKWENWLPDVQTPILSVILYFSIGLSPHIRNTYSILFLRFIFHHHLPLPGSLE